MIFLKIIHKLIYYVKNKVEYILNIILLKAKKVNYDKTLKINGIITIIDSGKDIKIGKNTIINSSKKSNLIGGDNRTILRGKITIGDNSGISNSTLIAKEGIIIGNNVLVGNSTKIYDTDFHSIECKYRLEHPDKHIKSSKVEICDGAFVGAHCIILKGVTIGRKSVVGAGSVVTHDIPDNEIWAGNPAKFIRKIDNNIN